MDPATLKAYLQSLCDELDAGNSAVKAVRWAGAALVASGAMTACFEKDQAVPLYATTFDSGNFEGICDDVVDNDDDGLTDCDDPDCDDDPACEAVDEYGAPPAEMDCTNEQDDDDDGLIDCDDPDCSDDPACVSDELYGVSTE